MLTSYGERFRVLRESKALTQEQVAAALKYKRPAPVSLLERKSTKVPRPRTIHKHAAALRCQPWELLAGVPTEYDWLRTPQPLTAEEMSAMLLGLAYLSAKDRRTVFDMCQAFLDALPPDAMRTRARARASATPTTSDRSHRGTKRA